RTLSSTLFPYTTLFRSLIVLNVARPDFNADWITFHLRLVELPARRFVAVVDIDADDVFQTVAQFVRFIEDAFFMLRDRNDHRLDRGDARRHDQPAVVAVDHDERAHDAR